MKNTENRRTRVIINSAGGNASKNAKSFKISLPSKWMHKLAIDHENREIVMTFDGDRIVIEKVKNAENAKEWMRRNRLKKSMLTILTSACPLPSQSYLNALDDWVDGKLTIEELISNSDKGLYLEDRNGG